MSSPPNAEDHFPLVNQDVESGNDAFAEHSQAQQAAAPSQAAAANARAEKRKCRHPVAALFHVGFKLAALMTYLLMTWFVDSFVLVFIFCVLLLVFDFWTVKNVTGRLLVGLRWWNEVKDDGTNQWNFESLSDMSVIDPMDSKVFWGALFLAPVVWGVLGVVAILKLNFTWLLIVVIALILSSSNAAGYLKCRKDAKQKVSSYVTSTVIRNVLNRV